MVDVMDAETKTTWFSWNKRELEKVRVTAVPVMMCAVTGAACNVSSAL